MGVLEKRKWECENRLSANVPGAGTGICFGMSVLWLKHMVGGGSATAARQVVTQYALAQDLQTQYTKLSDGGGKQREAETALMGDNGLAFDKTTTASRMGSIGTIGTRVLGYILLKKVMPKPAHYMAALFASPHYYFFDPEYGFWEESSATGLRNLILDAEFKGDRGAVPEAVTWDNRKVLAAPAKG